MVGSLTTTTVLTAKAGPVQRRLIGFIENGIDSVILSLIFH